MVPSERPVVDQSYQVALKLIFPNQEAGRTHQTLPQHLKFI